MKPKFQSDSNILALLRAYLDNRLTVAISLTSLSQSNYSQALIDAMMVLSSIAKFCYLKV